MKSAELVSKFGFNDDTRITILGVSESSADLEKIKDSIDYIGKTLGRTYKIAQKIRNGDPIEEILAEALENSYDLVAVGGGGNQLGLLHPQIGPTTGRLARKLHTHFLVARNIPEKFSKVLICTGADVPESETMKLGGKWLSRTDAQVSLLHVIPVSKAVSDKGREEKKSHDRLIEHSTKQLRASGVKTDIIPLLRHGLVVEEVLKELSEQAYELLVVGSHYQPGQDRWQGMLLDDITDQLLNRSSCSILII
jgi:nucleotide-binding universal stress UspA family protein